MATQTHRREDKSGKEAREERKERRGEGGERGDAAEAAAVKKERGGRATRQGDGLFKTRFHDRNFQVTRFFAVCI